MGDSPPGGVALIGERTAFAALVLDACACESPKGVRLFLDGPSAWHPLTPFWKTVAVGFDAGWKASAPPSGPGLGGPQPEQLESQWRVRAVIHGDWIGLVSRGQYLTSLANQLADELRAALELPPLPR